MKAVVQSFKRVLPGPVRGWLNRTRRELQPRLLPLDRVRDFSALRSVFPYRSEFGYHRGQCIDRYYIEKFLHVCRADIRGSVLEVHDNHYTRQFGGDRVSRSEIVDVDVRNAARTMTADLTNVTSIAANEFDCVICTQVLNLIYDYSAAVRTLHSILKPGGVLLATVPGISKVVPPHMSGAGVDCWRFTSVSARRAFADHFGPDNTDVVAYGNVLSAVAFLNGLVVPELTPEELDYHDPEYEVVLAVRAQKNGC